MIKFLKTLALLAALLLIAVAAYIAYESLRERTFAEKTAEIIYPEDRRELSDGLKGYLDDDDYRIRGRAALAVGRIGAEGAGRLLYDLITTDSSMDVAARAAFALGLTTDKQFTDDLLDYAIDLPSKVAMRCVEAAGRLTDTSMIDEINQIADFLNHPSPEVRQAACMSLFRAGAKDKWEQLTSLIESEPDEEVQVAALYALARLGVAEAFETYVTYFAAADPFVRSLTVRGLGLTDRKEAIHYLTIALNDSDERVVAQAVVELARKQDAQAKTLLVKKLSKERDEKLKVALINAARRQENAGAIDAVNTILSADSSSNVVQACVRYLAKIQKDRAVMLIDSLQTLDDASIRAACVEAYGIIGTQQVVPRLASLFNDRAPLVRMTAFGELMQLDSTNVDFYLISALEDSSYVMPVLAIDQIKNRELVSYLPRLNALMSKGSEVHVDIRTSLVDCVEPFVSVNERDTAAMEILIAGLLDSEYIVRRRAAEVYETRLEEDRWARVPPANTRYSLSRITSAVEKYQANPYATIVTDKGEIELELYFDTAPLTVMNFIELAERGFYQDLIFHRVIPNFVAQGGDPEGTGWGGPDYFIRCEYSERPYRRGTVGIATSGKDTGGSQFFIAHSPLPHLDGRYTVFGFVVGGMDVVDQIVIGDSIREITIHEGAYE